MVNLTEFLLARITEDEAAADQKHDSLDCDFVLLERFGECSCGYPARVQAQCAALRAVVEMHKSWPVLVEGPMDFGRVDSADPSQIAFRASKQMAWLTEQEYRQRFGTEPPTAPMLRALASIYADHPDYDPGWAL